MPAEAQQYVLDSGAFERCFARHQVRYAFGRADTEDDAEVIESLRVQAANGTQPAQPVRAHRAATRVQVDRQTAMKPIYDKLSRRQFLRGTGGALLAIPLLPSLLPREAEAQAVAQASAERYFVHMTTWHGCFQEPYFGPMLDAAPTATTSHGGIAVRNAPLAFTTEGDQSVLSSILRARSSLWTPRLRGLTNVINGLDFARSVGHNRGGTLGGSDASPTHRPGAGRGTELLSQHGGAAGDRAQPGLAGAAQRLHRADRRDGREQRQAVRPPVRRRDRCHRFDRQHRADCRAGGAGRPRQGARRPGAERSVVLGRLPFAPGRLPRHALAARGEGAGHGQRVQQLRPARHRHAGAGEVGRLLRLAAHAGAVRTAVERHRGGGLRRRHQPHLRVRTDDLHLRARARALLARLRP